MIFGEFDAHPEFLHFRCPGHNCVGLPNGRGGDKAGRDHPAGLLVFQCVQTCFASFLRVQTGVHVLLSADWNRVFMLAGTGGSVFVNGVLCVEFRKGFCKECFAIQVWLSFLLFFGDLRCLAFSNPAGRSGGVFACGVLLRVFAALLGVRGFWEGQRQEGARSIISVVWGSVHSSDVFADGGSAILVLMGKSLLRTRLQFMD